MIRVVVFILFTLALNGQTLSLKQIYTLKTIKDVALKYPNKKGETFEKTLMAICMVESDCGRINFGDKKLLKKGLKRASYGVMQVQLETAKFVINRYNLLEKLLSDTKIIDKLMNDTAFCAKIATLYINWLSEHSSSYFEMVSRYNGGKINYPYFNRVKKKMRFLDSYPLSF